MSAYLSCSRSGYGNTSGGSWIFNEVVHIHLKYSKDLDTSVFLNDVEDYIK